MSEQKNYAVLIDSENVSSKYAESIFQIMSEYGDSPIRRIYGDFSTSNANGWKEKCNDFSIKQIHHYNNVSGKNSSDFSLIIDAMDILYKYPYLDGYVIVSSDSDFTELVQRLKESCKKVIGMGEAKTPKSIINACSEFKYLENYYKENSSLDSEVLMKDTTEILNKIKEIIISNNGTILVSLLKEKLLKIYPDFDEKNYGYNQMNKFLNSFSELKIKFKDKTICSVSYGIELDNEKKLNDFIKKTIDIVKRHHKKGIALGKLNKKLNDYGFDYNELGYSKFIIFIESIPELKVENLTVRVDK